LKQSSEHSKDDIWLLDCLLELIVASSRRKDCQVGRTRVK